MTRATIPARLHWLFVPAIALDLFALTFLCYTAPADQTWYAGLYDDADHDDVVRTITEACAVPTTVIPMLRAPEAIRTAIEGLISVSS